MKKLLLLTTTILLISLVSCQKEETPQHGELQQITVTIPEQELTRADGDGAYANRCQLQIYRHDASGAKVLYGQRLYAAIENYTATFNLQLLSSQTYDFVFWADNVESTNGEAIKTDKNYNTADLTSITVNNYAGNNESFDAFTAVYKDYTVTGGFNITDIELTRPLGQVTVTTNDFAKIPSDTYKPDYVTVTFTDLPDGYNALTEELTSYDPAAEVSYTAKIKDTEWSTGLLTVDYLFAAKAESALADFKIDFYKGDPAGGSATLITSNSDFKNIPVRRNYQTKISGNLLTSSGSVTVTVVPGFTDPAYTKEIVEVLTVNDIATALNQGATNIVVQNAPAKAETISIPKIYTGESSISIEIPASTNTVTIQEGDGNNNAPSTININVASESGTTVSQPLVINTPNSTVNIKGNYNTVSSITADQTLIVEEGTTIGTLTVKQGSVEIYGLVQAIELEENAGKVTAFVNDEEKFRQAAALSTKGVVDEIVLLNNVNLNVSNATELVNINGVLNLNNQTLEILDGYQSAAFATTGTLLIKDGNVNAKTSYYPNGEIYLSQSTFRVEENATAILENVNYKSETSALFPKATAAKLYVKNSTVEAAQYGIATNATNNEVLDIVVENSTITGGSIGIQMNVESRLSINNSEITGNRVGLNVRGGTATVSNSVITLNAAADKYADWYEHYLTNNWGTGDDVPSAALTMGNKTTNSYQYPTYIILNNTRVKVTGQYASQFQAVYARANQSTELGVTFKYDSQTTFDKEPVYDGEYITVLTEGTVSKDVAAPAEFLSALANPTVDEINVTADLDLADATVEDLTFNTFKTINLPANVTVTLGENNYITAEYGVSITGEGTLTNPQSETISKEEPGYHNSLLHVLAGECVIDGVTLINDMNHKWHRSPYNSSAISYWGETNVTIRNAKIYSGEYTLCGMGRGTATGTITLQDSYFESTSTNKDNGSHWAYAMRLFGSAMRIDNCVVKGIQGAVSIEGCQDAIISSGTYYTVNSAGNSDAFYALYITNDAIVTITGGRFIGGHAGEKALAEGNSAVVSGDNDANLPYGSVVLKGGKFNGKAYNHVTKLAYQPAEGYVYEAITETTEYGDLTYQVVPAAE